MNDPYNLFEVEQPPEPVVVKHTTSSGGGLFWILIAAVLGLMIGNGTIDFGSFKLPDPTPAPSPIEKEGGTIVFIHERQDLTLEQDQLLKQMPDYCKEHNLAGYRSYDVDTPGIGKALDFAKEKGVVAPFVVYVTPDKEIVSVIPWPADAKGLGKL